MAPNNQQQQAVDAAAIRLPDFYVDSPQSWFDCLDSTFATANITQSIAKFHWALAKLPFSLIATVRPLSRNPTAVSDPYKELRSYGLSTEQMTNKWLDYPMCGDTRPSVLWDNLTALQQATVKDAQTVLFICKLPRHISNLINPRAFKTSEELIQRCNELWMAQTPEEAAAAAAAPSPQSSFRSARRSPSPFRRKTPGGDKSGRHRSPTPGAARGGCSDSLCFYHSRFGNKAHKCEKGCSYQKTNRPAACPHFAAAASPIPACCPPLLFSTGISHSYVHFPHKKPNFPS
jgi:hypothetical protein